tara:strand:- start:321 stop:464 length:144 start_codon:yes stop_codon:yes gene_type:complete
MSEKQKEISPAEKIIALFLHLKKTIPNDREFGTKMRSVMDALLEKKA